MKPTRSLNRTGDIPDGEVIQDDEGRILGSASAVDQGGKRIWLPRDLVPFVKDFLIQLQKDKRKDIKMATDGVVVNQAKIAGVIKSIKTRTEEGAGFILVDVGEGTKFIPCTIHEEKTLAAKLERFQVDDFIQLVGFCRAWSQKKDGEWRNSMEVRITRIANDPPKRDQRKAVQQSDDDIPF